MKKFISNVLESRYSYLTSGVTNFKSIDTSNSIKTACANENFLRDNRKRR